MDLHMVPQTDGHQTLLEFKLVAGPEAPVFEFLDWQGNRVHHLSIAAFHDREIIVSNFNIEIHPQRWRFEQLDDSLPMTTLDIGIRTICCPTVQCSSSLESSNWPMRLG